MPVIHTHVSVPTTQEQRDTLKNLFGQAITAVPGKTENWLVLHNDDMAFQTIIHNDFFVREVYPRLPIAIHI